ncbi:MAG: heme biosynthesis HemY N-terminal domain-containing protein [Pseudomonadota bacterium]|nr:heme biosynthesis HemY N-terminal domain-containing protein [Pseudomonadota bacterium]
MWRLITILIAVAVLGLGLARFAEQPGTLNVTWLGYQIETSVLAASFMLAFLICAVMLVWSLIRYVITRPAAIARGVARRREVKGLDALSRGLIAVGAGDRAGAEQYAAIARRSLPNQPLTSLLQAQAAQRRGDRAAARRIFESLSQAQGTELLGLRGLYLEARHENESVAAKQFAERAVERNPDLAWSVNALFDLQCREGDWEGALATLDVAKRRGHVDKAAADRRRAVLLTAQAQAAEEGDIDRARTLALEAHKLAPGLVPAAELAGRLVVVQGNVSKASKILSRAWELSPHPDLTLAYAHLRSGDAPPERLKRVAKLASLKPESDESAIALARAAVEAREWQRARDALSPLLDRRPSARVCALMARIEDGENASTGRAREWMARAMRAPRDPAWIADGVASRRWAPVSPVTGRLDAYEWTVPPDALEGPFGHWLPEEMPPARTHDLPPRETSAEPVQIIAPPASPEIAPGPEEEEEAPARPARAAAPAVPQPQPAAKPVMPRAAPDDPGPGGDLLDEDVAEPAPGR